MINILPLLCTSCKIRCAGARSGVCVINNSKAGTSWCCTSMAEIRAHRAWPWCYLWQSRWSSPSVGIAAGAVPGFYF